VRIVSRSSRSHWPFVRFAERFEVLTPSLGSFTADLEVLAVRAEDLHLRMEGLHVRAEFLRLRIEDLHLRTEDLHVRTEVLRLRTEVLRLYFRSFPGRGECLASFADPLRCGF